MEFTYKSYEELLYKITTNYHVVDYHNYRNVKYPCILRHDIDMWVDQAINIARIEQSVGIKATYFVLLNSGFYNPAFSNVKRSIYELLCAGHEIGLHFDEAQYPDCDDERKIKEYVYYEADLLGREIGQEVRTVSMHRPSLKTLEADYVFDGIINSYSKVFLKDFKYLSDSRMRWREPVEEFATSREERGLHILTHPIWYREQESNLHDILSDFISKATEERAAYICENIRDFRNIIPCRQER